MTQGISAAGNAAPAQPQQVWVERPGSRARTLPAAAGDDAVGKRVKKGDKMRCYRCDDHGHHGKDCTVEVCDICESKEHASERCPLLSARKPQVIMHG